MKKLLFFIFTLLLPLVASADVSNINIDGINYNLSDKDKTAEVTSSPNRLYSGEVTIPATVTYNDNQYSVTSIGEKAFYYCSGLTSVTIPNSVTSIGNSAFQVCSKLTSVTIPNSVISIGDEVFQGCHGLTSITIPYSVTHIGEYAFLGCYVSKEKVHNQSNMPLSGLTICDVRTVSGICIKDNIFVKYLGKEPTITIPNNITSIGDEAFYHNSELTSINIPNNVTNIGEKAFGGCSGLTSVTIPNSITSIGKEAFGGCSGLTSIIIPNNLTSISKRAYAGCTGLTSINIPNSVTNIEDEAFENCSGLTSVNFSKKHNNHWK